MLRRTSALVLAALMMAATAGYSPVAAQDDEASVDEAIVEGAAPAISATELYASILTPAARRALAATSNDSTLSVVVRLDDQVDLAAVLATASDDEPQEIVESLREQAERDQFLIRLLAPIWENGPEVRNFTPFWIINGFSIEATPNVIASIARFPNVAEIDVEQKYVVAGTPPAGPAVANVQQIGAPTAWSAGATGEGVVVAVLDTGVDMLGIPGVFESEVADSWRGGTNSWFDPYGVSDSPYDLNGHGTAAASIITGGDLSGSTVGVAPGASWIAAKIFDDSGTATTSAIHAALQWVLDPDGDPSTDDAADIVNASWTAAAPGCDTEFAADLAALRAADILPVFAAGNFGPTPGSSPSPSNLPGALAVGAVKADLTVVAESSRGPTECGGATRTYPHLVAPGDSITAQGVMGQYVPHTGTSFAAPHVAGAAALLLEAVPGSETNAIEAALVGSATDLGPTGDDDTFGAGMVDVSRAIEILGGTAPDPTASIGGLVFEDTDGNGSKDDGELTTGSAQITLLGPGDDSDLGTGDDVIVGEAVTGPDGAWIVSGLALGQVRVEVAVSSLPLGATLTTAASIDRTLVEGVNAEVSFGWRPPAPGGLVAFAFDDSDNDGTHDPSEPGIAGITVTVETAGPDANYGTSDDGTPTTGVTGETGSVEFFDLPAGPSRITVDPDSLPDRGQISGVSTTAPVIESDGSATVHIGVHVPIREEAVAFISLKRAGRANDNSLSYRDEDILVWDGTRFELLFDGSDIGLATADIDAFHVVDETTILMSFDRPIELDDVGWVDDNDVVRFDATQTGGTTRGTLSIHLDGSDLGLSGAASDIDAITAFEGNLLISLRGNVDHGGIGLIRDEDLVLVSLDEDGVDSASLLSIFFDGSAAGLSDRSEDIDGAALDTGGLRISTLGDFSVPGVVASDGDLLRCADLSACIWNVAATSSVFGLDGNDIDGISLPEGSEG